MGSLITLYISIYSGNDREEGWLYFVLIGAYFVMFSVLLVAMNRDNLRTQRAATKVALYEAELTRRHAARGRDARRWQKAHPILW